MKSFWILTLLALVSAAAWLLLPAEPACASTNCDPLTTRLFATGISPSCFGAKLMAENTLFAQVPAGCEFCEVLFHPASACEALAPGAQLFQWSFMLHYRCRQERPDLPRDPPFNDPPM